MTWDHHFFKTCCNFNPVLWKPTKEPSGKDRESIRVRHCDRLDVFGRMAVVHPAVCRVGAPVHGGIRRFYPSNGQLSGWSKIYIGKIGKNPRWLLLVWWCIVRSRRTNTREQHTTHWRSFDKRLLRTILHKWTCLERRNCTNGPWGRALKQATPALSCDLQKIFKKYQKSTFAYNRLVTKLVRYFIHLCVYVILR